MQTKHDANLDFLFLMQMLFDENANVLCRGADAKFIHDDVSAHIQTMMQMSPHKDGDVIVF